MAELAIQQTKAEKPVEKTNDKLIISASSNRYLTWNKANLYPAIDLDSDEYVLIKPRTETSYSYYHLYLSTEARKELRQNSVLLEKIEQSIKTPKESTKGKGIILTKDTPGNFFVKVKVLGKKTAGGRVGGHIDDQKEDENGNQYYAINLSEVKLKHN